VALGGFLAACGSSSRPQNLAVAKEAVEQLSFDVHGTIERHVLVGRVDGGGGDSFRFFVFIGRSDIPRQLPGIRGYKREVRSGQSEVAELGSTSYVFVSGAGRGQQDRRQRQAKLHESYAIEDALCEQGEGSPCPPI
jgi:hypothetical protein